ncbi:MAG: hypothetical protein KKB31_07780 [Nanoarchaeota archaeon]|nr:hypothetical protein [Nanoarchaeota archaeon]
MDQTNKETVVDENMRVIEIGGVKLEVDMRTAKTVEKYRVGDGVKVLVKEYSDKYATHPGVIVGFAAFKERPALEVLYVTNPYSGAEIKFLTLTADTKDTEITPLGDYEASFGQAEVLGQFDRKIQEQELAILDTKKRRAAFEKLFGRFCKKE